MISSRWTLAFVTGNEDLGDEVLPAMAFNEPVMGPALAEIIESQHTDNQVGDKLMARFS